MSDIAIRVQGLGKRYRIGRARREARNHPSFFRRALSPFRYLVEAMRRPRPDEILWAIRDVSFEIERGAVVGIIGRNGAGKSTLLRLLSRITEPTCGRALVRGRVGSLLEVGTGFHPELTGRENIFLSGAILGMRRKEIARKFDEIVAFAGVEKFLETPVKRYSSGMYVRLAFAVAAHLEPEVLLVDEVLAVGDAAFQKKCLGRMTDVASEGRTVLFVSHNMIAVQNLCARVLWLHEGRLHADGPAADVLNRYLAAAFCARREQHWPDPQGAPGNDIVRLRRVCIRPEGGTPADPLSTSVPLIVEVEFWNLRAGARLHLCLHVLTEQQAVAFTTGSNESDALTRDNPLPEGLYRSSCRIPADLLNSGVHRIVLLFLINGLKIVFRHEEALLFEVLETGGRPGAWYGKEPGAVHPKLEWETLPLIGGTAASA